MIQVKRVHESVQARGILQGLLLVKLSIAADPRLAARLPVEKTAWNSACGLPRPTSMVVRGLPGGRWLLSLAGVSSSPLLQYCV